MLKKLLFTLVFATSLSGCMNTSNTLNIQPKIVLPQQDPGLTGITVSISGADLRSNQALAKVNRDGKLITLTANRDLRFLLQEVLEKQMAARGYMTGPNGVVDLQVVVSNLFADVTQGNLRYSITTKADISVSATAKNGNKQVKNYRQTYSTEGAFNASNQKIADAVNATLEDVITDMAQDTSIHNFIKQNAHQ